MALADRLPVEGYAGIVLCGGRSSRMGRAKALLPFGPELMLQRAVRLIGEVVRPIIVVAAPGQELPSLADDVHVVHDRREGRGPLEGIAAGLAALPSTIAAAYVTSCDAPLLRPDFVRRMIGLHANRHRAGNGRAGNGGGGCQIAVPFTDGFHHPLAAVYSRTVLPQAERLLAEDRLRPAFLFDQVQTRLVTADELRDIDPSLASLRNLNRPGDYEAALVEAGFTTRGGSPAATPHPGPIPNGG